MKTFQFNFEDYKLYCELFKQKASDFRTLKDFKYFVELSEREFKTN